MTLPELAMGRSDFSYSPGLAFQIPISRKYFQYQKNSETSIRSATVFRSRHTLYSTSGIPRLPRSHLFSRRRPRCVAAWLTGHADASVLCAARLTSQIVLQLRGNFIDVVKAARAAQVPCIYLHSLAASPSEVAILRSSNLVPIFVPSVPAASKFNKMPLLMAAAVSTPVLTEKRGDSVTRFFRGQTEDDAPLLQEKQTDERPWSDQFMSWLTHVYLPQGFPHTTTPDYISFTKYRTLQNLASAVMQVISTKALLFGLGLGKKVAAGAAATSWVAKDGFGYLVKIGYGSLFGSKFDDDPKSWRIASDVVEDIGGAIEILTPLFPRGYFLPLASLAVCLRGTAMMTGTATRHVVYRSLAASGMQNTGDIATKGESQGVTMKMLGLGLGIIASSRIGERYYALLVAYTALAGIHIAANWKSVQCVQFSFLNKQRASIVIDSHLQGKGIPNPYDVSHRERIILPPWRGFEPSVKIGAGVKETMTSSRKLDEAIKMFKGERFLVLRDEGNEKSSEMKILLRENASSFDVLRAYFTVKHFKANALESNGNSRKKLKESLQYMRDNMESFEKKIRKAGWDTRHMLLADDQIRVNW